MHLYNTTFGVDRSVEQEFMDWLRSEFIPSAVADGEYFSDPELFRVGISHEPDASSFALHLRADSVEDIDRWYADHGSRLFASIMDQWNGAVVFFSTTLEAL